MKRPVVRPSPAPSSAGGYRPPAPSGLERYGRTAPLAPWVETPGFTPYDRLLRLLGRARGLSVPVLILTPSAANLSEVKGDYPPNLYPDVVSGPASLGGGEFRRVEIGPNTVYVPDDPAVISDVQQGLFAPVQADIALGVQAAPRVRPLGVTDAAIAETGVWSGLFEALSQSQQYLQAVRENRAQAMSAAWTAFESWEASVFGSLVMPDVPTWTPGYPAPPNPVFFSHFGITGYRYLTGQAPIPIYGMIFDSWAYNLAVSNWQFQVQQIQWAEQQALQDYQDAVTEYNRVQLIVRRNEQAWTFVISQQAVRLKVGFAQRKRRDRKNQGHKAMYNGLLSAINKTYGEADEIGEYFTALWSAIEPVGPASASTWDHEGDHLVPSSWRTALKMLADGRADVNFTKFFRAVAWNLFTDRFIGEYGKANRKLSELTGRPVGLSFGRAL